MTTWREKLFLILGCFLFLQHAGMLVSAQCHDYEVADSTAYHYGYCECDVLVSETPNCLKPPSQEELDTIAEIYIEITNISLQINIVKLTIITTSSDIEITKADLSRMTTKLERIESGDLKVNQPEFDFILQEINDLEQVLRLLEEEHRQANATVAQLKTELEAVETALFELEEQDVETLLQQIEYLEDSLEECQSRIPTVPPPGSGDDDMFVPWEDIGTQDSCADLLSVSSSYTVRTDGSTSGVWMRDPLVDSEYPWHFPVSSYSKYTYRFLSYDAYERQSTALSQRFTLSSTYGAEGTGMVAYNGSLYFNYYNSRNMYRYDVRSQMTMTTKELSDAGYGSSSTYSYKCGRNTGIDFAVDEYGLWVIYSTTSSGGRLYVSHLDPETLESIQTWSTLYPKRNFGNCFMVCAKLYCVDTYNSMDAKINVMFDTKSEQSMSLDIPLRLRYQSLYALDYNPRDQKLYGWDNGKMVIYDLNFGE